MAAWPGNELTEEITPWSKCQGWPATDPRHAQCDCVASHSRDCGVGALSLQGRDPGSATCSGDAATPTEAGIAVPRKSATVCSSGISSMAENCMAYGHAFLAVARI